VDTSSATRGARGAHSAAASDRHRLGVIFFLVAAFGSFLLSIGLWFTDNREEGVFVGLWVPSIHSLGTLLLGPIVEPVGNRRERVNA